MRRGKRILKQEQTFREAVDSFNMLYIQRFVIHPTRTLAQQAQEEYCVLLGLWSGLEDTSKKKLANTLNLVKININQIRDFLFNYQKVQFFLARTKTIVSHGRASAGDLLYQLQRLSEKLIPRELLTETTDVLVLLQRDVEAKISLAQWGYRNPEETTRLSALMQRVQSALEAARRYFETTKDIESFWEIDHLLDQKPPLTMQLYPEHHFRLALP